MTDRHLPFASGAATAPLSYFFFFSGCSLSLSLGDFGAAVVELNEPICFSGGVRCAMEKKKECWRQARHGLLSQFQSLNCRSARSILFFFFLWLYPADVVVVWPRTDGLIVVRGRPNGKSLIGKRLWIFESCGIDDVDNGRCPHANPTDTH